LPTLFITVEKSTFNSLTNSHTQHSFSESLSTIKSLVGWASALKICDLFLKESYGIKKLLDYLVILPNNQAFLQAPLLQTAEILFAGG
jgi:hypothetical protein